MNIAEFLLNLDNKYNGHHQTTITGIPLDKGLEICNALEEYDPKHMYTCEVFTDGSYTIYRKADRVIGEKDDMIVLAVEV